MEEQKVHNVFGHEETTVGLLVLDEYTMEGEKECKPVTKEEKLIGDWKELMLLDNIEEKKRGGKTQARASHFRGISQGTQDFAGRERHNGASGYGLLNHGRGERSQSNCKIEESDGEWGITAGIFHTDFTRQERFGRARGRGLRSRCAFPRRG